MFETTITVSFVNFYPFLQQRWNGGEGGGGLPFQLSFSYSLSSYHSPIPFRKLRTKEVYKNTEQAYKREGSAPSERLVGFQANQ